MKSAGAHIERKDPAGTASADGTPFRSCVSRRHFSASLIAAIALGKLHFIRAQGSSATTVATLLTGSGNLNPRWYGFNLLEYFSTDPDWMKYFPYRNDGRFKEDDFRWMRDWGFNFARLPMDYRFWTDPGNPMKIDERKLEPIDRVIRMGERYGIHVNICLHRAPGYCILDSLNSLATGIRITNEKTNLFTSHRAQDAFLHQWTVFAQRYKSIPGDRLSFNLVNEPKVFSTPERVIAWQGHNDKGPVETASHEDPTQGAREYARIARVAFDCIRGIDPNRPIVVDGFDVSTEPVWELDSTQAIQSAHDYFPDAVTSYRAEWARGEKSPTDVPAWPPASDPNMTTQGRDNVEAHFQPWEKLAASNVPIHFGEMGCYKYTPPQVVLAWFDDTLDVIDELGAGWALWNFRGPFGVLDTERHGTRFQNWYGHQLDRPLLDLLQKKMRN
jgi:endoglucanase